MFDDALGAGGWCTAHGANGVDLGDVLGDGHELGHGCEGAAEVILVEAGEQHAYAVVGDALDKLDDACVEELGFVDTDDLGVGFEACFDGCGVGDG